MAKNAQKMARNDKKMTQTNFQNVFKLPQMGKNSPIGLKMN